MKCSVSEEQLSAYVDDELCPDEREIVERHVKDCSDCAQTVRELYQVRRLVKIELQDFSVPDELENFILEQVSDTHRSLQARRLVVVYGICALMGIATVGLLVMSPLGRFVRASFKLSFAALHGILMLASNIGFTWIAIVIATSTILGLIAMVGVVRMLRSSEVAV